MDTRVPGSLHRWVQRYSWVGAALFPGGSRVIPWSASRHHWCSWLPRVGTAPERATSPSGCVFKQTRITNAKPSARQCRQPRRGGQRSRLPWGARSRPKTGSGLGRASLASPRAVAQRLQGRAGCLGSRRLCQAPRRELSGAGAGSGPGGTLAVTQLAREVTAQTTGPWHPPAGVVGWGAEDRAPR